ncbi:esiB [Symbiodinium sp. CCMP2592]|nr:esiB [Symbiodinium sp. CCMP2592]
MSGIMSAMLVCTSLLLLVSGHRVIGLRRGNAEKETRGNFLDPDLSRCEDELSWLKSKIQQSCEEDQQNGKTVSHGGCEAEAEAVVSDGDYEVWSQSLLKCAPEKTHLLLWSGYRDEEREEVLRPLRQQGGCVLSSQEEPDTRLGELLKSPEVNTLKSCSFPKVKAFWVGASRQFASTWAARSQNVTVAIGYHIDPGRSYKTLFDTVFYRSELKAAVQAFRDRLQVNIIFTNSDMTEGDMDGATSVIYERARLLSPVHAEKFQESTTWRWGGCAKESLASCQTQHLLGNDATFFSNLGCMYDQGLGVARDVQKAREFWERSMEMGHPKAPTNLGLLYQSGEGVAQDFRKAKELYELGIKRGDDTAPATLGVLYEGGQGIVQDLRRARELYEMGVETGDRRACYQLGHLYQFGLGVARDFKRAREFYELGTQRGDATSPVFLGSMYLLGQGVAKDFRRARELFELGMQRGDARAPASLGLLYQKGQGVAEDLKKAEDCYKIGIARGDDFAVKQLLHLGYVYEEMARDFQMPKAYDLSMQQQHQDAAYNFNKAKELYESAGASGSIDAMWNLAFLYKDDLSSDELACEWMSKAKEAGEGEAAGKLAEWRC